MKWYKRLRVAHLISCVYGCLRMAITRWLDIQYARINVHMYTCMRIKLCFVCKTTNSHNIHISMVLYFCHFYFPMIFTVVLLLFLIHFVSSSFQFETNCFIIKRLQLLLLFIFKILCMTTWVQRAYAQFSWLLVTSDVAYITVWPWHLRYLLHIIYICINLILLNLNWSRHKYNVLN